MECASSNCGSKDALNERLDYLINNTVDQLDKDQLRARLWPLRSDKYVERHFKGKLFEDIDKHLAHKCVTAMNEILRASNHPPVNLVKPDSTGSTLEDDDDDDTLNNETDDSDDEATVNDNDDDEFLSVGYGEAPSNSEGGQTYTVENEEHEGESTDDDIKDEGAKPPVPTLLSWKDPFESTSTWPYSDIPWMDESPTDSTVPIMESTQIEATNSNSTLIDSKVSGKAPKVSKPNDPNTINQPPPEPTFRVLPNLVDQIEKFTNSGINNIKTEPLMAVVLVFLYSMQCERDMLNMWKNVRAADGTYPHPVVAHNLKVLYKIRRLLQRDMVKHLENCQKVEREIKEVMNFIRKAPVGTFHPVEEPLEPYPTVIDTPEVNVRPLPAQPILEANEEANQESSHVTNQEANKGAILETIQEPNQKKNEEENGKAEQKPVEEDQVVAVEDSGSSSEDPNGSSSPGSDSSSGSFILIPIPTGSRTCN